MYRLSDSRYEEINKIVVDMFIRYDISSTPISAFEIAIKMGIEIVPYSSYPESIQKIMLKKARTDLFSLTKKNIQSIIIPKRK